MSSSGRGGADPPAPASAEHAGIVVAGFGNLLRGDDGFGVAVVRLLEDAGVPAGVDVLDVGIGGIHLVQRLLEPAAGLVVVDALDLGRPPGTVVVLRPDVEDVRDLPPARRHDALADMHYATPPRALMLARALGVLPPAAVLVGCQPLHTECFQEGLSPAVAGAVRVAADEVRRVVSDFGVAWPSRA